MTQWKLNTGHIILVDYTMVEGVLPANNSNSPNNLIRVYFT